jgi:hypothetical protein
MKLMTAILLLGLAGTAGAQNPDVIQDTRTTMKLVQQKRALDSDAALAASQGEAAKPSSAPAPIKTLPVKASPAGKSTPSQQPTPKPSPVNKQVPAKANTGKSSIAHNASPASKAAVTPKPAAKPTGAKQKNVSGKSQKSQPKQRIAVEDKNKPAQPKKQAEVINLTGRRDPFISPVVNRSMVGSGCSTGKRCLAIGEINLKGVVRADTGMIAVVVNTLNKAYFLRENDPVFNGYVVKITGDSIIFKEQMQDKLGKPFTREVTKKITTPAV